MLIKIKLKLAAISIIAIVLTLLTQTPLAYYQQIGGGVSGSTSDAASVVTSGNLQLVIHEKTAAGTDFPTEGVYIVPGDIVSKQVSIENICAHPFYLRVKVVYGIDSQELSADDCFKLNIDETNWVYYDGWYYYTGVVEPGQTTPYVFSHVEIVGDQVDNNYIGKTLTLTVVAQAVQSENNPVTDGQTYEAFGWPQE